MLKLFDSKPMLDRENEPDTILQELRPEVKVTVTWK